MKGRDAPCLSGRGPTRCSDTRQSSRGPKLQGRWSPARCLAWILALASACVSGFKSPGTHFS